MYNSEKYIANCIDSILTSDLPIGRYEVIIVNDGSTDNGPQIAQEYVSKYDNFTYLTQENQGQSVARNRGIRHCSGEYVWCVDADDMVNSTIFTLLKRLQISEQIDILAFQLRVENEYGQFIREECTQPNVHHDIPLSGRSAIISGYNPSSVCALWIRKRFMIDNELLFKEGITHQDVELSYRLLATASFVLFTSHSPYIYMLHPNSTSQSINPVKKIKYLSDDIIVYKSFKDLAIRTNFDIELSYAIFNRAQNILFTLVYSLYINRKQWAPLGINKAVINNMKKNNLYPLHGPFDSWKKRFMSYLLNIEWLFC